MKLDLLTNATVVNDAMKFVSQQSTENLKSPSNNIIEDNKKVSNETNNNDEDQFEEKQEEQTTQQITLTSRTTNEVF
ncbi:MAG TPA: hypothetical protein VE089_00310 [Nitrososphaeraceae archaeon]|jgi:hypothetical protein|nr:hypothetical protein [Nitrososphaeraceae archaeon]